MILLGCCPPKGVCLKLQAMSLQVSVIRYRRHSSLSSGACDLGHCGSLQPLMVLKWRRHGTPLPPFRPAWSWFLEPLPPFAVCACICCLGAFLWSLLLSRSCCGSLLFLLSYSYSSDLCDLRRLTSAWLSSGHRRHFCICFCSRSSRRACGRHVPLCL